MVFLGLGNNDPEFRKSPTCKCFYVIYKFKNEIKSKINEKKVIKEEIHQLLIRIKETYEEKLRIKEKLIDLSKEIENLKKLKEQINKINAKYDIELAALEQDNPQTQSSILDYFKMFNLSNTSKTELSKYEVVNATGIQTSISKLIALPKTPDFEDTKFLNNFITASLKAGNIKLKKTDAATTRIEDIEELNQKVEQHLKFCYQ